MVLVVSGGGATAQQQRSRSTGREDEEQGGVLVVGREDSLVLAGTFGNFTQKKDSWSHDGCLIGDDDDDDRYLHHDGAAHDGGRGRRSHTSNWASVAMEVAEDEEAPP